MQVVILNTEESKHKFAAYNDARRRSYNESTHWDDKSKIQAERMKLALDIVYSTKHIYIAFRKKFISVKLDNARVIDKKNLQELEAQWTNDGIVKVVTAQGVTYRIPKAVDNTRH